MRNPSNLARFLKWWPLFAAVVGGAISVGSAAVYAAVMDHRTIAENVKKIEAIEIVIPKMQSDIQVICWTVADGKGCSR